jgi:hypothetical protein
LEGLEKQKKFLLVQKLMSILVVEIVGRRKEGDSKRERDVLRVW